MIAVAVAVFVLVWITLCYGLFRLVRGKAVRIEHAELDTPEKVHQLQRMLIVSWFSVLGGYLVLGVGGGAIAAAVHDSGGVAKSDAIAGLVAAIVILGSLIAAPVLLVRGIRPSIARVRDVPTRPPDRKGRTLSSLVVVVPYVAILAAGRFLVPRHGTGHAVGMFAVYLVGLVALSAFLAPLAVVRLRTKPMPDEQRARLRDLAERLGVRVRDFRVLQGRTQKLANAFQMGMIPGLRYVVVTDYLVDHVSPDELDAVVAHELGHAKRHHLAVKLGVVVGLVLVLEVLAALVGHAAGSTLGPLLVLPVVIAIPVGLILVQGLLGVRLEEAADDVAAEQVGSSELAGALRTVGQLNHTKRDTGRVWSIITQHPGLQDRLDRLAARRAEPAPV